MGENLAGRWFVPRNKLGTEKMLRNRWKTDHLGGALEALVCSPCRQDVETAYVEQRRHRGNNNRFEPTSFAAAALGRSFGPIFLHSIDAHKPTKEHGCSRCVVGFASACRRPVVSKTREFV